MAFLFTFNIRKQELKNNCNFTILFFVPNAGTHKSKRVAP